MTGAPDVVPAIGTRVELWTDPDRLPQVGTMVDHEAGGHAEILTGEGGHLVPLRGTFVRAWRPTLTVYQLTLWRPWAAPILAGAKRVENRPRPWWCLEGQLLALHNGHRWDVDGAARIRELWPQLQELADEAAFVALEPGAIVGVVQVTGAPYRRSLVDGQAFDPWVSGPWVLPLSYPVVLEEPIRSKGSQGLRRLEDGLAVELEWAWRVAQDRCAHLWVDVSTLSTDGRELRCHRCNLVRLEADQELEERAP